MDMSGQLHTPAAFSAANEPPLHVAFDAFHIVTDLSHTLRVIRVGKIIKQFFFENFFPRK
jgi:hypothetical protein